MHKTEPAPPHLSNAAVHVSRQHLDTERLALGLVDQERGQRDEACSADATLAASGADDGVEWQAFDDGRALAAEDCHDVLGNTTSLRLG